MVETLGEAKAHGWRITARCALGKQVGLHRFRECVYRYELDLDTLIWTRGAAFLPQPTSRKHYASILSLRQEGKMVGMPLDYFPDASVKHDDWEVAPVTRLTFAAIGAGSGGLFSFRNGSYDDPVYTGLTYDFIYVGGGLGTEAKAAATGGLKSGGLKGGQSSLFGKKWHPIHCSQPFSAMDLDVSFGVILSFTAAVYDWIYMSAWNTSGGLFTRQWVSGFGLGAGADVTAGVWVYAF